MSTLNNSFKEFISFFPEHCRSRTLEVLFLNSKKVKNLDDYYLFKNSEIDFEIQSPRKLISKVSNESYPIARITKKSFFRNNELFVQPGVFMPRPETEFLVDIVCKWIKKLNLSNFSYLDLCTGSGNIVTSILDENKAKIFKFGAVDCSFLGCQNTLKNICSHNHHLSGNVYLTNWIKFLEKNPNWDVITINPPYIGLEESQKLKVTNLYKYEPKWSLQAGLNGWSHYHKIIEFSIQNFNWKMIVAECNEFHESLWDNLDLSIKNIHVYKYKDYLEKFRVVVLIRM